MNAEGLSGLLSGGFPLKAMAETLARGSELICACVSEMRGEDDRTRYRALDADCR